MSPSRRPILSATLALLFCLSFGTVSSAQTVTVPGLTLQPSQLFPVTEPHCFGGLAEDRHGSLWIGVGGSRDLFRMERGQAPVVFDLIPSGSKIHGVATFDGRVYLTNDVGQVFEYTVTPFAQRQVGSVPHTSYGLSVRRGEIRLGTDQGVFDMDPVTGATTALPLPLEPFSAVDVLSGGGSVLAQPSATELTTYPGGAFGPSVGQGVDGVAVHPVTGDIYFTQTTAGVGLDEIRMVDAAGTQASSIMTGLTLEDGQRPSPIGFSRDGTILYVMTLVPGAAQLLEIHGFPAALEITVRAPAGLQSGDIEFDFDVRNERAVPTEVTVEFSTDGGNTFTLASTPACAPLSNPSQPLPAPSLAVRSIWNSLADSVARITPTPVDVRLTARDEFTTVSSSFSTMVDNTLHGTMTSPGCDSTVEGVIDIDFDADDSMGGNLTGVFEFSTDGGLTYSLCTADASSTISNPTPILPTPVLGRFIWNSLSDSFLLSTATPTELRFTVSDGGSRSFEHSIDLVIGRGCTLCGDCGMDGSGVSIVDSLMAAQIGAGIMPATISRLHCCDVNNSGGVDVLDSLMIAQSVVALPVNLTCP